MEKEHKLSVRQGCRLLKLSTSVYYYQPKVKDDQPLIDSLDQGVELYPGWGFWKLYRWTRRSGHIWNHKRLHRVYVEMGLNIRRKRKKRLPARVKEPLVLPIRPNITWSMDFVHDSLRSGKTFRSLCIIDDFNREALAIISDTSLGSERVKRELDRLCQWRGKPEQIRVDNGPEFTAQLMEIWAEKNKVELKFIQPGKPTQNSYIERFNRTYRDEVLNAYLFDSLNQVRQMTQEWIWTYNNFRSHDSLMNLTPREFLLKYGKVQPATAMPDFPTLQQDQHQQKFLTNSLVLNVANQG